MKCMKCGCENDSQSKFCKNCGASLRPMPVRDATQPLPHVEEIYLPDDFVQNSPKKEPFFKRYKVVLAALASALVVCLAFSLYLYFSGSSKYEATLNEAQNAYQGKNYPKAIELLKEVPESSKKDHKKAKDMLALIHTDLTNDLESKFYAGQYQKVLDEANRYLATYPDSEKLRKLVRKADNEIRYVEGEKQKQKEAELNKQVQEAKQAAATAKKKAKAEKRYYSNNNYFAYSWQVVQAAEANVRSGPGLEYSSLYVLNRGEEVYVNETVVEAERIWCNIGDGWISSRTLTGEL